MRFKEFVENDFNNVGDISSTFSNEDGGFKFSEIESKYFTKSYRKNIKNGKIQKILKKQRRRK